MLRKTFSFSLLLLTAVLLATTPALHGQTSPAPVWTMITPESTTTAVTLPAGTTYRFGDSVNNKWAQVTVTVATTINPVSMSGVNSFPFADPDPGTAKELDALETSATQTIGVTNLTTGTTVSQVVSALVPPPLVPLVAGTSHTVTFTNFAIPAGTTQNALMFAFVNQPPTQAARTWQGTQMNLTIDGVTMTCTYGQTYTDGVFSLTCTVPTTPGS